MKEFIEKLIGRLEEAKFPITDLKQGVVINGSQQTDDAVLYDRAIEIVNELAEEYNNGWIPCEKELPKKDGTYLVTVKNLTGYYIMEENVFACSYWQNEFIFRGWEDNAVIAWMPLPQPYKAGD